MAPLSVFADVLKMPTMGLSVVNFDNDQHGSNENLRIQNFWTRWPRCCDGKVRGEPTA